MIDRQVFFDAVRASLFNGSLSVGQVDGIDDIFDAWDKYGDGDIRKLSYLFATDYHETAVHIEGVDEFGHGAGHSYGQPAGPFHQIYFGRGDPEMTWYANYVRADNEAHKIGLLKPDESLVKTPELANRRDVSAWLLVAGAMKGWWTTRKLADYFNATTNDPVNARRVINGTDKANTIAHYHNLFLNALKAAEMPASGPVASIPVPSSPTAQPIPKPLPTQPMGPLAAFIQLIAFIITTLLKRKAPL